ncbi:hypothetical protein G7070_09565 [Propioniciclava coleopterorum]|uniref:Glycerophosphoryl diester phosphodiesterase membrane domain-containing protein n=1 Tax=Propioniciclava coleopterorum TaxID=2714937 RepID=A0A6G7Y710_9ACTN|nr:glycerophosphoryl diester phosphodiesterase membrane domain-containing protein [Propioniciclava coleopterorum]QIK72466.1 hypothetical protein G7070_09565 [Propioniciclava coleopterorum]
MAIIAAVMMPQVLSGRPDPGALMGSIIGVSLLGVLIMVALSIFTYVFYARMMVATLDYATGRTVPTWATLTERTRGLMGRLVGFILICAGIGLAAYVVFASILFAVIAGSGGNPSGGATFLIVVATIALMVAAVWVSVRITYALVIMAEEGLKAWDALKRSFALTKGAWWRTFGYQLVIGLVVGIITSIPQGMITGAAQSAAQGQGAGAMGFIGGLLAFVLSIALIPVSYIWIALMYLGRTREVANAGAGYPVGPSFPGGAPWNDPGQPFGQTPGQYDDGARYAADPQQPYPGAPEAPGQYGAPGQYDASGQYGAPDQPGQQDPFGRPDAQPGQGGEQKPGEGGSPTDDDFFGRPKN